MDREAEISFRRDLENAGEASVRADFYSGGGLSTGGEDRRKIIREWLRDKEKDRQRREEMSYKVGQRTFWVALATLVAAVVGVIATILHK
ncbi:MAG TPA: hypothetical protein VK337_23075 [Xanthobacteraceae bacterium]|nr:hypothetical protein [Xanthobacteraceae bacterium]